MLRWTPLLALALAGCAGPMNATAGTTQGNVVVAQQIASGYLGCRPDQIEITEWSAPVWISTWRARCGERVFRCMHDPENSNHCALEQPPVTTSP